MTPDQRATWAKQQAAGMACLVRDEPREGISAWLSKHDRTDLEAIAVALACMVPIDQPVSELLAWLEPPTPERAPTRINLKPCGTRAAAERHRVNGEALCQACRDAVRAYDRARRRDERGVTPERWRVA